MRGTHKDFYDALLQNLHVHEGVDDLDVDTLLMAVRQAPRLEEIGASEGWGCFWMDLCAVVSSSSTRLLMGQEIARRGFGHVLVDSLVPRPNVFHVGKDLSRIQDRVVNWTSNFANVWCWRDPELVLRATFLPHLLDFSDEDMVQFFKLGTMAALTMARVVWEADGALDEEAALMDSEHARVSCSTSQGFSGADACTWRMIYVLYMGTKKGLERELVDSILWISRGPTCARNDRPFPSVTSSATTVYPKRFKRATKERCTARAGVLSVHNVPGKGPGPTLNLYTGLHLHLPSTISFPCSL